VSVEVQQDCKTHASSSFAPSPRALLLTALLLTAHLTWRGERLECPSPMTTSRTHGVIVGRLTAWHPDRMVVGDRTMFLRDGEACPYEIGMFLNVTFIEHDGRRDVESITPVPPEE
jgi:hypothetical protein